MAEEILKYKAFTICPWDSKFVDIFDKKMANPNKEV